MDETPEDEKTVYVLDGHQDGGFWRYQRTKEPLRVMVWSTAQGARDHAVGSQNMLLPEYRRPFWVVETTLALLRDKHEYTHAQFDGREIDL